MLVQAVEDNRLRPAWPLLTTPDVADSVALAKDEVAMGVSRALVLDC
jgi:hypothetical protein